MKIINQVNDIAFASLRSGPAAFWHPYLWNKIHATHIAHSNRGLFGAEMAIAPNMMIEEVHKELSDNKQFKNTIC